MNPKEYEELVCEHFREQGYDAETTSYVNDYGVDVFAINGKEKIAIQAKMYGEGRKINRQMIMELHGAKDYFDCSKAVIATDGQIMSDAILVAKKLKIDILRMSSASDLMRKKQSTHTLSFEYLWESCIFPLQGKTLVRSDGRGTNVITAADWSGIKRLSSSGKPGEIKIEIFKHVVNKLLLEGSVSRQYINDCYVGRASSGIVLILSQIPFFEISKNPLGLVYWPPTASAK